MQMSEKGVDLIKHFEGCKLTAYQDSVGIWTIGYGWTQPVNGTPIGFGLTITQACADELLSSGLEQYEKGVDRLVKVTINQCQFDALVSFAYNLGVLTLQRSTLLKKLNDRDYTGAAAEFLRWNKANGKMLSGLIRRRTAERLLFLSCI